MQKALADAAESVVRSSEEAGAGVRRVPAQNFHLTLAFLGSVPQAHLAAIDELASRCARSASVSDGSVEVVLDGVEHWRKPQILCVTGNATPVAATRLAESLKGALKAEPQLAPDFNPLEPEFRSHVTIARKVRRPIRPARIEPQVWSFGAFALVESRTRPQGSEYAVVATYPLL